jgi:hypothetical protein
VFFFFPTLPPAPPPRPRDASLLRLRSLLRNLAREALEIASLKVVTMLATRSPATLTAGASATAAATITAASSSTIPAASATTTATASTPRRRALSGLALSSDRRLGRLRHRGVIHFRFDDDALEPAEEAALLEDDVVGELIALDPERFGGHRQRFVETLTFKSLRH